MRARFETAEFEFSHGRTPRGRGSWAFQVAGEEGEFFTPGGMTYTEGKRWMTEELRRQGRTGTVYVTVLP